MLKKALISNVDVVVSNNTLIFTAKIAKTKIFSRISVN